MTCLRIIAELPNQYRYFSGLPKQFPCRFVASTNSRGHFPRLQSFSTAFPASTSHQFQSQCLLFLFFVTETPHFWVSASFSVTVVAKWSIPKLRGLKQSSVSLMTHVCWEIWAELRAEIPWSWRGSLMRLWSLTIREEAWLPMLARYWEGHRRQGHRSLMIKLANLGLLTWRCWLGLQDQPEKASSNVQALLKSLSVMFTVVTSFKANHMAKSRPEWMWEGIIQKLTLREVMSSERHEQIWGITATSC